MKAIPVAPFGAPSITSYLPALTVLALVTGCVNDPGLEDEDASGTETFGGSSTGGEGDVEFRTYEGQIANPAFGLAVRTGTTACKTNELAPTCGYSSNAPEVSYTWTAPATASYTFSTKGSSFDTILHIRSFTNSAVTLGCNDNTVNSLQSSVSLSLTVGTTVIIVVDGAASHAGDFELNITRGEPCPGGCTSTAGQAGQVDQCISPNGTCFVSPSDGTSYCQYFAKYPNGSSGCNDGNACTIGDYCWGSSCIYSWIRTCNQPPNDCFETWGSCLNPGEGTDCLYNPKVAGSPCDDGLACTTGDTCNGQGTCVPQVDTCNDGCDPTTENCDGWGGGDPPAEMGLDPRDLDPQGFAAAPASAEPPPLESLDVEAFMALERQLREQDR